MNPVLAVLGTLLLLIVFLLMLRVKIIIEADDSARVYLKILFIKIKLVPSDRKKIKLRDFSARRFKKLREKEKKKEQRKKDKKAHSEKKKKQKKTAAKKKTAETQKPKKSVSDILDIVSLVSKLVGVFFVRFSKRLRLDLTKIHIKVGGEDAAAVAISYGIICQGVNALLAALNSVTNVKPKKDMDVEIYADFLSEKIELDIKLAASLRVWHAFDILFSIALKYVKERYFSDFNI